MPSAKIRAVAGRGDRAPCERVGRPSISIIHPRLRQPQDAATSDDAARDDQARQARVRSGATGCDRQTYQCRGQADEAVDDEQRNEEDECLEPAKSQARVNTADTQSGGDHPCEEIRGEPVESVLRIGCMRQRIHG